jgi:hypothetical protein
VEKKSVGLLELETAVLECFLEKTPFTPVGIKPKYPCVFLPYFVVSDIVEEIVSSKNQNMRT